MCQAVPYCYIDHDHSLSPFHVRGLVCASCNVRLSNVDTGRRLPAPDEVEYLRRAWHLDRPPPPNPTRRNPKALKSIRVRRWLLDQVDAVCAEQQLTFTAAAERAFEEWVRRED